MRIRQSWRQRASTKFQNEAMLAALTEKGYEVTHVFAEGTHSDAHGGSIMPDMLRWLWRDYPK